MPGAPSDDLAPMTSPAPSALPSSGDHIAFYRFVAVPDVDAAVAQARGPGVDLRLVGLAEGTGGPQDARVLYTAADVLADLAAVGADPEVVHADRVARTVAAPDGHGDAGTAYDALVHVRRR